MKDLDKKGNIMTIAEAKNKHNEKIYNSLRKLARDRDKAFNMTDYYLSHKQSADFAIKALEKFVEKSIIEKSIFDVITPSVWVNDVENGDGHEFTSMIEANSFLSNEDNTEAYEVEESIWMISFNNGKIDICPDGKYDSEDEMSYYLDGLLNFGTSLTLGQARSFMVIFPEDEDDGDVSIGKIIPDFTKKEFSIDIVEPDLSDLWSLKGTLIEDDEIFENEININSEPLKENGFIYPHSHVISIAKYQYRGEIIRTTYVVCDLKSDQVIFQSEAWRHQVVGNDAFDALVKVREDEVFNFLNFHKIFESTAVFQTDNVIEIESLESKYQIEYLYLAKKQYIESFDSYAGSEKPGGYLH